MLQLTNQVRCPLADISIPAVVVSRTYLDHVATTVAKAALRRKKQHEKSLEQTSAQIAQVEQQIYSIEAANINQETLNAMRNAGAAMKQIHGGLTIDKVDATMDELREQHALGEEIASAITNAPIGEPIDEADLEEELEGLEQEAMDEKMLKTGTVPVTGEVSRLPAMQNGPGKFQSFSKKTIIPRFIGLTETNLFFQFTAKQKKRTKKKNYGNSKRKWPFSRGLFGTVALPRRRWTETSNTAQYNTRMRVSTPIYPNPPRNF